MFDPLSISAFANAVKSLADLKGRFISEEKRRVLKFIDFCENVNTILQLASDELKKDNPEELGVIGARLGAWAGTYNFVDPALKEHRDNLSRSVNALATEMTAVHAGAFNAETRQEMLRQLKLLSGHLTGLKEVLRFQIGAPSTGKATSEPKKSNLTRWLKEGVAAAAVTAVTGAVASGAEHIPGVGPTLADWIRGSSNGNDTDVA